MVLPPHGPKKPGTLKDALKRAARPKPPETGSIKLSRSFVEREKTETDRGLGEFLFVLNMFNTKTNADPIHAIDDFLIRHRAAISPDTKIPVSIEKIQKYLSDDANLPPYIYALKDLFRNLPQQIKQKFEAVTKRSLEIESMTDFYIKMLDSHEKGARTYVLNGHTYTIDLSYIQTQLTLLKSESQQVIDMMHSLALLTQVLKTDPNYYNFARLISIIDRKKVLKQYDIM